MKRVIDLYIIHKSSHMPLFCKNVLTNTKLPLSKLYFKLLTKFTSFISAIILSEFTNLKIDVLFLVNIYSDLKSHSSSEHLLHMKPS